MTDRYELCPKFVTVRLLNLKPRDATPSVKSVGKVGFRTYQIQSAVRNIVLTKKNQTTRLEFKVDKSTPIVLEGPQQRALAGLCKLVMNLNEFVYVD